MKENVTLITGTSSGIGRDIALRLQNEGYKVYGTSRTARDADWPMLVLDVCDENSVGTAIAELMDREGRLDTLVNNVGSALVAGFEETSPEELQGQFDTNVLGAFRMMRSALPLMRAAGCGRIINISALAGMVPYPYLGAYSASKHALEALSEVLFHELFDTQIHVSLVEPEGLRTNIVFQHPRVPNPAVSRPREALLGRLEDATQNSGSNPTLVADAVLHLLREETPPLRYIVGEKAKELIETRSRVDPAAFAKLLASG